MPRSDAFVCSFESNRITESDIVITVFPLLLLHFIHLTNIISKDSNEMLCQEFLSHKEAKCPWIASENRYKNVKDEKYQIVSCYTANHLLRPEY